MGSADPIRAAIQTVLDTYSDGWSLSHYVIAVGLDRIDEDGQLATSHWWYAPNDQPDYITDGLLIATDQLRAVADD